jgi:hypothetical protein
MKFQGAIFDVDGVLVGSPCSRASRDGLRELMDTEWANIRSRYSPDRFTEAVYQQVIAGLPRLTAAGAALTYFSVSDPDARLKACDGQAGHMRLHAIGPVQGLSDAVRFLLAVQAAGDDAAPASSSRTHLSCTAAAGCGSQRRAPAGPGDRAKTDPGRTAGRRRMRAGLPARQGRPGYIPGRGR